MVARHLSLPHRFVCMTDDPEELPDDIETLPMEVPPWRWNLRKMALYRPDNGLEGRVLAMDLDTLIVGSLDDLAGYRGRFCTLEDVNAPGQSGGGIIGFEAGTLADDLWWPLVHNTFVHVARTKGSERMYYRHMMPDGDLWQRLYPGQFADFKPPGGWLKEIPAGARVIHLHGKPRNHEAARHVDFVNEHWR